MNSYLLHFCCTGGDSLPVTCNPSTSTNERVQPKGVHKKPLPKVMNARHLSGGKKSKDTIDLQQALKGSEIYRPAPGSENSFL